MTKEELIKFTSAVPPKTTSAVNVLMAVLHAKDEALILSRADCHASRVSSIVTGKTCDGSLIRIFLAWPGHQLEENHLQGQLPVGIHDHRYDLELQLLAGRVKNTVFSYGPIELGAGGNWPPAHEWRGRILQRFDFQSGLAKGNGSAPIITDRGAVVASTVSSHFLSSEWTWLNACTMHNIQVDGGRAAAWKVIEGEVRQTTTTLLSPAVSIDTTDLYKPFDSPDEVRSHVAEFVRRSFL